MSIYLLIVKINVHLLTVLMHELDVRRITASFVFLYKMNPCAYEE
jgi:hypothetical protein